MQVVPISDTTEGIDLTEDDDRIDLTSTPMRSPSRTRPKSISPQKRRASTPSPSKRAPPVKRARGQPDESVAPDENHYDSPVRSPSPPEEDVSMAPRSPSPQVCLRHDNLIYYCGQKRNYQTRSKSMVQYYLLTWLNLALISFL